MQTLSQRLLQNFKHTKLANLQKAKFSLEPTQSIKDLVGPNPVRGFSLQFAELEKQNPKCINLALGVPMDPTFPSIVESKKKFVDFSSEVGNNGYGDPRGIQSLRQNLTKSFRGNYKQTEQHLNENNIVICPGGTSNALSLSMERLLKGSKGEGEVLIMAPFFGPYLGMVKLAWGNPVVVDTDAEFQPNFENLERAVTPNTKAIIMNSPNNPTGKVYPRATIEKLIKFAEKHNIAIISDEIYKKFTYNEEKPFISLKEYFHLDQTLVVVNAPSKTYGMIGDRLGYIVGNKTEFIEDITITLGYRFASSPYLGQYAYDSIFEDYESVAQIIEENRQKYAIKAQYLVSGLNSIGLNAQELEGGMFAMTEVKSATGMNGDELSQYFLNQEAPVAVYPGSFFGESFKDYLRFTICPTTETLEKGLETIDQYLKNLKK